MSKKKEYEGNISWNLHLLVRRPEHLASAESFVFDVENRRVFAVSIWVSERDDRFMISSVGFEARCNNWWTTVVLPREYASMKQICQENVVNEEPYNRQCKITFKKSQLSCQWNFACMGQGYLDTWVVMVVVMAVVVMGFIKWNEWRDRKIDE